jgi:ribosomal protein L22
MPNTEKPLAKEEKKKIVSIPKQKSEVVRTQLKTEKKDKALNNKNKSDEKDEEKTKQKTEEKKKEKKKPTKKTTKIKKTEAKVNFSNLPISTKYSIAICKFIKNKKIDKAISELENVLRQRKVIPMKGEIAHKKGVRYASGSGKYPKRATEHFIKMLKSLKANANYNELEEPVIKKAIANIGKRPFGRFGRWRKKRSHISIIVEEKQKYNQKDKKKE